MLNQNSLSNAKRTWKSINAKLVLILLVLIFSGYIFFVAMNLELNIVPDEPYHFAVSRVFSTTWGIPEEVSYARNIGVYTRRNPFLGYWIYGRALNLFHLIQPISNKWQQLVFLRVINGLFSIGTVIFTYLFSKELIKHKWWQLLPVFALTNTLMFVLLSSGVTYDNLTNMLSAAGLFYLLRVFNQKNFVSNSLGWLITISIAALVKETVLPLALAMGIAWLVFIFRNRRNIDLSQIQTPKSIGLITILTLLVAGNLFIYGVNLIKHQSLTPNCLDYYPEELCNNTGFAKRREQLALPEELNMLQAFRQGYPEPIRYFFDTWIRAMLMKIFGIMGGSKSYYPIGIVYYHILFYWMIALGFRYFKKTSFRIYALAGILGFYTLTLFIKNYDIELAYGFIQVALQGRYLFPVIGIAFGLFSLLMQKVPHWIIRIPTLLAIILLFIYGGPIRFILYYQSVFADWFI